MTPQELTVRDNLAKRAHVDREMFEVSIEQTGPQVKLTIISPVSLDADSLRRIDAAMSLVTAPWLVRYGFYLALAIFVLDAVVLRSWTCLIWLVIAWIKMPRKCPDCGLTHS